MYELAIRNILVPTDFSDASLNAMDTAVAMAQRHDARLTLLHVVNQSLMMYGPYEMLPINPHSFDIFHNAGAEMLSELADKLTAKHGIEADTVVSSGFVPTEICKAAGQKSADLVVMGTHGTSGFHEFFIGTNTYEVVKYAPCPVLSVPPSRKWERFSTIVFPVRDVPNPLEKYDFLRKIIRKNQATLIALGLNENKEAHKMQQLDTNVRQLESQLRLDDVQTVVKTIYADQAAHKVLEIADAEGADLIAITANLDYDIRDFFIGPYTQQIVHHSKIPVLSIRPKVPLRTANDVEQKMKSEYPDLSLQYPQVAMSL